MRRGRRDRRSAAALRHRDDDVEVLRGIDALGDPDEAHARDHVGGAGLVGRAVVEGDGERAVGLNRGIRRGRDAGRGAVGDDADEPPAVEPSGLRADLAADGRLARAAARRGDRRTRRAAREKQGSGADQGEKRRSAARRSWCHPCVVVCADATSIGIHSDSVAAARIVSLQRRREPREVVEHSGAQRLLLPFLERQLAAERTVIVFDAAQLLHVLLAPHEQ